MNELANSSEVLAALDQITSGELALDDGMQGAGGLIQEGKTRLVEAVRKILSQPRTAARNYEFGYWDEGKTPVELFDKKNWLECLHACMCAASRTVTPKDVLADEGVLHELCHLALGIAIALENSLESLRKQVLDLQLTTEHQYLLERTHNFIRDNLQGNCKMLSLGNSCRCALCDFDRLVSLTETITRR